MSIMEQLNVGRPAQLNGMILQHFHVIRALEKKQW
jgi:hypothetical protein